VAVSGEGLTLCAWLDNLGLFISGHGHRDASSLPDSIGPQQKAKASNCDKSRQDSVQSNSNRPGASRHGLAVANRRALFVGSKANQNCGPLERTVSLINVKTAGIRLVSGSCAAALRCLQARGVLQARGIGVLLRYFVRRSLLRLISDGQGVTSRVLIHLNFPNKIEPPAARSM
jgi:hypothetical protein